jgi:cytochrome d ubiquinol oxidase subunit II
LPLLLAGAVLVALNAYVLLAGADFGGGVWDLLATGSRARAQRDLVAHAIGPIWEANHVWLILGVVLLFVCFPAAYARLSIVLNIPLTLALFGIVLRGAAFVFRSYGGERDAVQGRWGRVFAVASLATPLLLGVAFGAVASGAVGRWVDDPTRGFAASYVAPWLTPFALDIGVLTVTCFAYLAAVYLTLENAAAPLREDFRVRALVSGIVVLVVGARPLFAMQPGAPVIVVATVAAGTAWWALWTRRYPLARVAAAGQVSCVIWGWALRQYPYVLPPTLTIESAAAPDRTLTLVLAALALGLVILVPSLGYLFGVFKRAEG